MCLTRFLPLGGCCDDGLVNCLFIERCARHAAYMFNPDLLICWVVIVYPCVEYWTWVETTFGSLPEECHTEVSSMSLRHGHESISSIDNVACYRVIFLSCAMATVVLPCCRAIDGGWAVVPIHREIVRSSAMIWSSSVVAAG